VCEKKSNKKKWRKKRCFIIFFKYMFLRLDLWKYVWNCFQLTLKPENQECGFIYFTFLWILIYVFRELKSYCQCFSKFSLTLSLLAATESTHVTSADQDQLAHLCCVIMTCTVCYLVSKYFEIFDYKDKWFYSDWKLSKIV
jgi:hypothetical protein